MRIQSKNVSILGALMFLWVSNLLAQAPDTLWTRIYGGTNYDDGNSVQQTSDGGYIIAGGTRSFGAGSVDGYLVKTDSLGDTLWTKTYGGTDLDNALSVQQTYDDGYIIAGLTRSFGEGWSDVYLIKTNTLGDIVWTKTVGGSSEDIALSVQQTFDGAYIVVGSTVNNNWDVYLIKIASETGIKEDSHDLKYSLALSIFPNPFKNRISISYELPQSSHVHIVIYNLLGQEVRTLANKKENAGVFLITWNGRNNFGMPVTSGVYFCKLQVSNYTETRKIMLLK